MSQRIYIFKGFERFWHWAQAALILFLLLTGFEVHGSYRLLGFEQAVNAHTTAAWTLVGLWCFAVFWHFTTGEWRQYIPSFEKVTDMVKFYAIGIFMQMPHPYKVHPQRKHNPLQRLTYLGILAVAVPLIWITGWFYLFHDKWADWGLDGILSLDWVAFFHTLGAFIFLIFVIAHVYLTTTGHTPLAHIKAMITGWEEVE